MLRQIALTAGTRLGLTVFGLVTSIVTARFLGQSGRGDYFFMVTLAALIVQFANLGLPSSNTYFAARDPERTPQLVANALWVSLGVGGGLGVGIALFAHAVGMLQDTPASYLWLAAALAPPTLFYLLVTVILVGRGQIRRSTRWSSPSGPSSCRCFIAAGVLGRGATGFVAVSIVVWLSAGCGGVLVGRYARFCSRRASSCSSSDSDTRQRPISSRCSHSSPSAETSSCCAESSALPTSASTPIAAHRDVLHSAAAGRRDDPLSHTSSAMRAPAGNGPCGPRFGSPGSWSVVCALTAVLAAPVIRVLYLAAGLRALDPRPPDHAAVGLRPLPSPASSPSTSPRSACPRRAARRLEWRRTPSCWSQRALIPEHGAAGAAAALSIGNIAVIWEVWRCRLRHRDAKPGGPAALGIDRTEPRET